MENLKINAASLFKAVPLAALMATAVNTVLYLAGDALGVIDHTVSMPGPDGVQPITLVPVVMSSIIPVVLAGVVLAVVNRFAANPLRVYGIITVVFLVLSLANPFLGIPGIPLGMGLLLCLMHITVAGISWYVFSRYTRN